MGHLLLGPRATDGVLRNSYFLKFSIPFKVLKFGFDPHLSKDNTLNSIRYFEMFPFQQSNVF